MRASSGCRSRWLRAPATTKNAANSISWRHFYFLWPRPKSSSGSTVEAAERKFRRPEEGSKCDTIFGRMERTVSRRGDPRFGCADYRHCRRRKSPSHKTARNRGCIWKRAILTRLRFPARTCHWAMDAQLRVNRQKVPRLIRIFRGYERPRLIWKIWSLKAQSPVRPRRRRPN